MCGKVVTFYFSPQLMGVEDAWYVREGTPKRAAIGMALMRGFVSWCLDTKGAVLVQSGDVAGIRTVAVDALYRHMGFTRFGTIYKYARAVMFSEGGQPQFVRVARGGGKGGGGGGAAPVAPPLPRVYTDPVNGMTFTDDPAYWCWWYAELRWWLLRYDT